MYRILFFDIDGTLRDEAYGIPETAKTAVIYVRKKTIIFAYVQVELLEQ